MDNLLKKLTGAFGVSGHESEIREVIRKEIENIDCRISEDKLGNLIVNVGSGSKKVMLCAHMDTIGIIATYIDSKGFVRIGELGGIKAEEMINSFVKFENGTLGKICSSKSNPEIGDLFIELGGGSREETLKLVKEGEVACFLGETIENGDKLISTNLDNRVGCYVLIKVLRQLFCIENNNKEIKNNDVEYSFVFSSQNTLGGRGARAAAFSVDPDYCLVVDVEEAGDRIGGEGIITLKGGPIARIMDRTMIIHREVKSIIDAAAETTGINLQYSTAVSGTDGALIHKEKSGIKTGVLAIPCRYVNSTGQVISLEDVENMIKLLKAICEKI